MSTLQHNARLAPDQCPPLRLFRCLFRCLSRFFPFPPFFQLRFRVAVCFLAALLAAATFSCRENCSSSTEDPDTQYRDAPPATVEAPVDLPRNAPPATFPEEGSVVEIRWIANRQWVLDKDVVYPILNRLHKTGERRRLRTKGKGSALIVVRTPLRNHWFLVRSKPPLVWSEDEQTSIWFPEESEDHQRLLDVIRECRNHPKRAVKAIHFQFLKDMGL
jgi:hypothetical protein